MFMFLSTVRSYQVSAPYKTIFKMQHFTSFFLSSKSILLVKRALFLLNAVFAITILDLISQVHLPSFVIMLHNYLKDSTLSSCFWFIISFTGNGCREICGI